MKNFHSHLPNLTKLTLFCITILLAPTLSYGLDASFTWTANPEPLTGYKLYYKTGTESSPPYDGTGLIEGDSPILLEKVTTTTVTGLSTNETYQFTLVAYNDAGDSSYSTVVPIQPATLPSPTIDIMSQNLN